MTAKVRTALVVPLSLAALAFPKLALPAALSVFLSAVALPQRQGDGARRLLYVHLVAGAVALLATLRFLAVEALPGIVQGGTSAAGSRAISRLREVLFVEDAARKTARFDPDGDGVGSALLIGELTGEVGVRGGARLSPPLLERYPKQSPTLLGPAVEVGGFFLMVCLPTTGGGLSPDPDARFDDEAAERRFVGYAWPAGSAPGLERAYFIDQHDRILSARSGPGLRQGKNSPPSCDDAFAPATRGAWRVWRGKQPRATLPGDHPR